MLIEIDISVLTEAQNGTQKAFDVLNALALVQKMEWHALWAERRVLDGIIKLPVDKLGDSIKVYRAVLKGVTIRKKLCNAVSCKAVVTFSESTHRSNGIIYINPAETKQPFSCYIASTLLTENINDCHFFEYIAHWYLRKQNLEYTVFCKIDKQMGGGNPLSDVYREYAENKKDRFCLCIADSDIKADINKLLTNKLLQSSNIPSCGATFKKVLDYDCKNQPFNCACYCFENVLEIENLIPYYIIENDSNYKGETEAIKSASISDLSYFDFKKGLTQSKIGSSEQYIKDYWTKIVFKSQSIPTLNGFGDKLLSHILDKHKSELSNIDDSMLSSSQLKEYEAIGRRVFSWCCTMSIARALI